MMRLSPILLALALCACAAAPRAAPEARQVIERQLATAPDAQAAIPGAEAAAIAARHEARRGEKLATQADWTGGAR